MSLENSINRAYDESFKNMRFGDKIDEIDEIKSAILNSKKIVVATNNKKKFKVVFDIISNISNAEISMLDIPTNPVDLTRT